MGAGGFGREVAWLVSRINEVQPTWNFLGFIDDNPDLAGKEIDGYHVAGNCDYLNHQENAYCVCAVGASSVRKKIVSKLKNVQFATLIDPSVQMSSLVSIGEGSIICAGAIITVDVEIGNHVIVNLDCTIGHDAVLENFATLYPSVNVSGQCQIGEATELGTGVQIIQGKSICKDTIVGAGAVVVKDIAESGTYVGVPVQKVNL